jgi:hydrogenase maturation protease
MTRVMVAGIGNVFFGDDAFGVEVVRRLAGRPLPAGTRVKDFGIRGLDLAYEMTSGAYDAVVLVDAVRRGRAPGDLVVLDVAAVACDQGAAPVVQGHAVTPDEVLRVARTLGDVPAVLRIVGCEPKELGTDDDPVFGLSPEVEEAVGRAVGVVEATVASIVRGDHA